jgi:acyl carrier protein
MNHLENQSAFLSDLADVLELPASDLVPGFELTEEKWDSLAIISSIALIDDHFGITVSGKDLGGVRSVAELLAVIAKHKA